MTRALFYVEVTKSGWVLANDEAEALEFEGEIMDNNEPPSSIKVSNYSEALVKESGWDADCLVYHNEENDSDYSDLKPEIPLGVAINELV